MTGIERARQLYQAGVNREVICKDLGIPLSRLKGVARRGGWTREPEKFEDGVRYMSMPGERFARIPFAKDYFVSDLGRVLSMRVSSPGVLLQPWADRDGYQHVGIINSEGASKRYAVHRLVMFAFEGGPPSLGFVVAHGNGIRSDNRLPNLRWATQAENLKDMHEHGTSFVGERHPRASITADKAAEIKRVLAFTFTLSHTAELCGVSRHVVADISAGKSWRHA